MTREAGFTRKRLAFEKKLVVWLEELFALMEKNGIDYRSIKSPFWGKHFIKGETPAEAVFKVTGKKVR